MQILGKSKVLATVFASALFFATSASADAPPAAPAVKPVVAPTKAAPTATPSARDLLASGEKKFKAADFTGALADFEAASAAKPSPEADRFIALTHDKLGQFAEAVTAYERFLGNVPPAMKAQADEFKGRVDAIRAMPGKVHVDVVPAGAHLVVDAPTATGESGASPAPSISAPADLELKPGHHTVRVVADGFENAEKAIDVPFASKQDLKVELTKIEPPPPPPPPAVAEATPPPAEPPAPAPRSMVPAYVTGAVAIVAASVGTGFGIAALSQSSDFKAAPTAQKADDGDNQALIADMMFGVALTFGVTSAVLFFSKDAPDNTTAKAAPARVGALAPAKRSKVTIVPAPYVTPHGGGAGALVRF